MAGNQDSKGPDFTKGIPMADIPAAEPLAGHVGDEPVLLTRFNGEIIAVGAKCTHYGGPLGEGIVVGETIRCPWHHARFSLQSGEAIAAPAFDPIPCWRVERQGDRIVVREKRQQPRPQRIETATPPRRIVIVGGGAAGFAAAEMLRRRGYDGDLTILSADEDAPYDRPSLSKEFLAGQAPEDWIPLRPPDFYETNRIALELRTEAVHIDTRGRTVALADGRSVPFDRLLLATGAEPVRLAIPGADQPHVRLLRTLQDSRAIIERAQSSRRAVVMGASFIGLEVAASLRARDLEVHVVAPVPRPMEKVLGPELGDLVRALHEQHGVHFHLQRTATSIDDRRVTLSDGTIIEADLVVVGIGVKPRVELAERSGIATENGVLVNEHLETNVPGIYAAGDIARWPDAYAGERIRVEHWVVAERQGQAAALNLLGADEPFLSMPFFWSAHYDLSIRYVGHAENWDATEIEGSVGAQDCVVRFRRGGRLLAAAALGRDREALEIEAEMESRQGRLQTMESIPIR
jgi:NADPH-dependent 2,4-dienoyl-CoA reductase/sulfur reductase-like enzyme/nitrite reductase/ring-hydroxylating ferredoxin subunit